MGNHWSISTVDGRNPSIYRLYRVLYIPGGAGFLPSTVITPVFAAHVLWGIRGLLCILTCRDDNLGVVVTNVYPKCSMGYLPTLALERPDLLGKFCNTHISYIYSLRTKFGTWRRGIFKQGGPLSVLQWWQPQDSLNTTLVIPIFVR